jgi:hypothetical protein
VEAKKPRSRVARFQLGTRGGSRGSAITYSSGEARGQHLECDYGDYGGKERTRGGTRGSEEIDSGGEEEKGVVQVDEDEEKTDDGRG